MVRLKREKTFEIPFAELALFPFHYGAIETLFLVLWHRCYYLFPFHYGAIETEE